MRCGSPRPPRNASLPRRSSPPHARRADPAFPRTRRLRPFRGTALGALERRSPTGRSPLTRRRPRLPCYCETFDPSKSRSWVLHVPLSFLSFSSRSRPSRFGRSALPADPQTVVASRLVPDVGLAAAFSGPAQTPTGGVAAKPAAPIPTQPPRNVFRLLTHHNWRARELIPQYLVGVKRLWKESLKSHNCLFESDLE